jgi:hypothetical protein
VLNNPPNEIGQLPSLVSQDSDAQLISILCWSALQLERLDSQIPYPVSIRANLVRSDLRAELDRLPKPGDLMYSESRTMMPGRVAGAPANVVVLPQSGIQIDTVEIMYNYTTQIYLRLTLNRVHTSLYAPASTGKHALPRASTHWTNVRQTLRRNQSNFWLGQMLTRIRFSIIFLLIARSLTRISVINGLMATHPHPIY